MKPALKSLLAAASSETVRRLTIATAINGNRLNVIVGGNRRLHLILHKELRPMIYWAAAWLGGVEFIPARTGKGVGVRLRAERS
jgi:hypothetical protein